MKILVFDDNATHRASAQAQLKDHDLTVVATYDEAQKLLLSGHSFDVVLSDLLVLASGQEQDSSKHVDTEMPVGIFIALLAAVKGGAKYVAVFTDSDHHSHPASACFDAFNNEDGETWPSIFVVEGAKVMLANNRNWVCDYALDNLSTPLTYTQAQDRPDKVRAKNWTELLESLLRK
jgi:hypothetical protein